MCKSLKNGHKKDGTQNFMCLSCGKQFIGSYRYKGANPVIKGEMIRHLERNNGIRDTAILLQISPRTVMRALCRTAQNSWQKHKKKPCYRLNKRL